MIAGLSDVQNMKTVSLKLPDALAGWLESQARSRRVSKSILVARLLGRKSPRPKKGQVIDILEEAWRAKVPATTRRWRSRKKQRLADLIRAKKLSC